MNQNINLYDFILKQRNLPLSFRTMTQVFYGFILLLVGVSVFLILLHLKYIHDLNVLEDKQLKTNTKLRNQESKIIPKQTREQITEALANQEKQFTQNQTTLEEFKKLFSQEASGFSPKLIALANSVPRGLWLNRIEILDTGRFFAFSGKTVDPFLITSFLEALSQQATFMGKKFEIFNAKLDDKDNLTQFMLKSKSDLEESGHENQSK